MYQILVIEDDRALSDGIRLALQDLEHEIVQAFTLEQGWELLNQPCDLVILDLNLPDGKGLDFLRKLRKESSIPVIILTANDMEIDIVTGLESGADDYITKPFSLMVLRARVNVRLRTSKTENGEQNTVEIGPFCFSFDRMEYFKNGTEVVLSRTEQKLLRILVQNRGNTVPRERLLEAVWTDGGEFVDTNALSVAVKRLRERLEDNPSEPEYIKNVYGIGYTWSVK